MMDDECSVVRDFFCIFGGDTNLNKEERSLFSRQFHPFLKLMLYAS
jgi:hypothetical protein